MTSTSSFAEESRVIVQRLFVRAAQQMGGTVILGVHLGLSYSELRRYLMGESIPPMEVLARALELVLDDLDVVRDGCSEQAWRLLFGSRMSTGTTH